MENKLIKKRFDKKKEQHFKHFYHIPVFPNKLKISLDSRSCKLETFNRPKKNSPDSMWSMADSYLVRPKKQPKNKTDQENKQIVGPMWLVILPDLPLFYLTCPVGPLLLGKTYIQYSLFIRKLNKNSMSMIIIILGY